MRWIQGLCHDMKLEFTHKICSAVIPRKVSTGSSDISPPEIVLK